MHGTSLSTSDVDCRVFVGKHTSAANDSSPPSPPLMLAAVVAGPVLRYGIAATASCDGMKIFAQCDI